MKCESCRDKKASREVYVFVLSRFADVCEGCFARARKVTPGCAATSHALPISPK